MNCGSRRPRHRVSPMLGMSLWLCLGLLLIPAVSFATVMGDLANQMQPGTWAELKSNGLSQSLIDAGGGHHILEFADKAVWDSARREFRFVGQGHYESRKHIVYADASNTWTVLGAPAGGGTGHAYQHNALDPAAGNFYYRKYNEKTIARYSINSGSWISDTAPIPAGWVPVAGAVEFFPPTGDLIFVGLENDDKAGIFSWDGSSWTRVGAYNQYVIGTYQNVAVYDPVHKVILFGGGTNNETKIHKLDSALNVTPLGNAPIPINITKSVVTVDPASGNYLVFGDGNLFYKYDITTDTWTKLNSSSVPIFGGNNSGDVFGVVATPVTSYGVTMFLQYNLGGNPKVYLYKHSASSSLPPPPSPDTTLPSSPTNLSASVISSSQINLSWNASTDNIGVTGYNVFRNNTLRATPTSNSFSDTGLSPSTTYTYKVQAKDAAGNVSSQTFGVNATTQQSASSPPPPSSSDFQTKCAQAGVLNCFGFDDLDKLFYNWPEGTACDQVFAGQTNYKFGLSRQGPGNTIATSSSLHGCLYPELDPSIRHSGNSSLKFTIRPGTGANTSGSFTELFKRLQNGGFEYIGPGSSLGNVFYFQFYQRFDPNFLNIDFQCVNGGCGGWKQVIWYGNPPKGSSSSLIESTQSNGWQRGVPQMYGQQGHDDYGVQDVAGCPYAGSGASSRPNYTEPPCVRYKADRWMEFTGRIEIRGNPNAQASRVQLWVDGKLVVDYGKAKVNWGSTDGDGFGGFEITPYHTNKDPNQSHPTAFTWVDDLIISTQPIAMTEPGGAGGDTIPPAAPANLQLQVQ